LDNIGLRKSNAVLTEQIELLDRCNNQFKLELERQKIESSSSQSANRSNRISVQVLPNPNTPTESREQNPFVKQSCMSGSSNSLHRSELPYTQGLDISCPQMVDCRWVCAVESPNESTSVAVSRKSLSVQSPSVVCYHAPSASACSTQLCETDVLFLKSLRELLKTSNGLVPKKKTAQNISHKCQKQNKTDLVYSQPAKRKVRSNSSAVKLRKKSNRNNKENKNRSKLSKVPVSKMKTIKKSVLANRRGSSKPF